MLPTTAKNIDNMNLISNDTSYKDVLIFDFEKGDFLLEDGKLKSANNTEALKLMISKLIKTEKFNYSIYSKEVEDEEFGIVIESLIGKNYPSSFILEYIKGSLEMEILKLKGIESISNITVEKIDDKLKVEFTVNHQFNVSEVI